MEFTKKKILSIIREMAMDFETGDRPSQDIQSKLASGDTPYKKVPLPKTGDEPNKNFQELLASTRYKEIVQRVRQYTGLSPETTLQQNLPNLMMMMYDAHNEIVNIENRYASQLEELAVDLVKKELGLDDDDFNFDAKIVGMGEIDISDFNRDMEDDPNIDEVDIEKDLYDDLGTFNLERAKMRLVSSMIQGASKRGHYMYQLVPQKIREITGSENLINLYSVLMSVNDTLYWQLSDDQMKMSMSGGGGGVGGKESVDRNTDPPTIIVRAINFPILVHELIKGVMDAIGIKSRPTDDEGEEMEFVDDVEKRENTLEKEIWDLRLGPVIWAKLREKFPEEILVNEEKFRLQLILFSHIVRKPAKEFLTFMKEVLSDTDNGKNLIILLFRAIEEQINDYDYSETMEKFDQDLKDISDNTDDQSLDDFYKSLDGIRRPDDDDDE